jgi:hypothetical protein
MINCRFLNPVGVAGVPIFFSDVQTVSAPDGLHPTSCFDIQLVFNVHVCVTN